MVYKSRVRTTYVHSSVDGVSVGDRITHHVSDSVQDSSLTGSARTEVSSVDKFLSDPANSRSHGFMSALQQDKRSAGDAGLDEFLVTREEYTNSPCSGTYNDNLGHPHSIQNFVMLTPHEDQFPATPPFIGPTSDELKERGERLYLRALPNRDQADLGTVLGEIVTNPVRALAIPGAALGRSLKAQARLGTPSVFADRAGLRHRQIRGLPLEEARAAADDYLAFVFGVRPTVNSLDTLAESLNRSRLSAEQVVRGAGIRKGTGAVGTTHMRRRRYEPTQQRSDIRIDPNTWVQLNYGFDNPYILLGSCVWTTTATQSAWFSGSFRMHAADTVTWLDQCDELFHTIDRITGLGLDIRTAWDLIPFSFMVDWFSNTGDLLEARQVISDYNIVCEYGYAMCHTRYLRTLTAKGIFGLPQPWFSGGSGGSVSYSKMSETKRRKGGANGFGFRTSFDSLNSFQWGALTALGLSSAPGIAPRTRS